MIYSFGDINFDLIWDFSSSYNQRSFPEKGKFRHSVGGVAYNLAKFSKEIGEQASIIGKIGNDVFGKYIIDKITEGQINHNIVYDNKNTTCLMLIISFLIDNVRKHRFMTYNDDNANLKITKEDISSLNISFKSKDILFITGYSIFRPQVSTAVNHIIEMAQEKSVTIVFDLLPHKLNLLEKSDNLLEMLSSLFKQNKIALCVGEFRTWHYLLNGFAKEEPENDDLENIADDAKEIADYICIRYGFENCEKEALFYKNTLLYEKDTGYKDLSHEDKLGFGEKLTVSLIQQLFLGKHSWLYSNSENFTIPLSSIDLLPPDLPRESTILDVGCGYGRLFQKLIDLGFKNITGLDTSVSMVKKAKSYYPNYEVLHGTVKHLKRKTRKFDLCILLGLLTTFQRDQDISNLFKDIFAVLNDSALLLVADFLINTEQHYLDKYSKFNNLFPHTPFGIFFSQNGVINRHFKTTYIYNLVKDGFKMLNYKEQEILTINKNLSRGFTMLCMKR